MKAMKILLSLLFISGVNFSISGSTNKNNDIEYQKIIRKQAFLITNSLALSSASYLAEDDDLTLNEIVANLKKKMGEIKEIAIIDKKNTIRAHSNIDMIGEKQNPPDSLPYFASDSERYIAEVPIISGKKNIGRVRILFSKSFFPEPLPKEKNKENLNSSLLLGVGLSLFIGIIGIFMVITIRIGKQGRKEYAELQHRFEVVESMFRSMLEYKPVIDQMEREIIETKKKKENEKTDERMFSTQEYEDWHPHEEIVDLGEKNTSKMEEIVEMSLQGGRKT